MTALLLLDYLLPQPPKQYVNAVQSYFPSAGLGNPEQIHFGNSVPLFLWHMCCILLLLLNLLLLNDLYLVARRDIPWLPFCSRHLSKV